MHSTQDDRHRQNIFATRTALHVLDEFVFQLLGELVDCDEVLHDVNVGRKQHHVLLAAACRLTDQRLQVLKEGRRRHHHRSRQHWCQAIDAECRG